MTELSWVFFLKPMRLVLTLTCCRQVCEEKMEKVLVALFFHLEILCVNRKTLIVLSQSTNAVNWSYATVAAISPSCKYLPHF